MNLWKSLVFEIDRIWKWLITVVVLFIVIQLGGLIVTAFSTKNRAMQLLENNGKNSEDFLQVLNNGDVTFSYFNTNFMLFTVLIPFFFLFGYTFWIWYKDWFGKQKIAYRLYQLPQRRENVYFAKLFTIIISVLLFVGLQFLLLPVELALVKIILPTDSILSLTTYEILSFSFLGGFAPLSLSYFIFQYSSGFVVIMGIFWIIVVERALRLRVAIFYMLIFACVHIGVFVVKNYFVFSISKAYINIFWIFLLAAFFILHSLKLLKRNLMV